MPSDGVGGYSLTLSLRYGRLLLLAAVFVHAIPICSALVAHSPWAITCGIACCVAASLTVLCRDVRLRQAAMLEIYESGEAMYWVNADSPPLKTVVHESFIDLGWIVVLRIKHDTAQSLQYIALTRDAVPRPSWRALRVWLNWRIQQQSNA